ncbi:hypothetical protein [Calothrix sp. PCC 7507]|uniref:hypothetical protein n=1 Tax=Calothrix sp. PCC 7507 TaxID=99598 RepID=UPI000A042925|nr:hypothetical protein [Calothrix sp. PCC 7507]
MITLTVTTRSSRKLAFRLVLNGSAIAEKPDTILTTSIEARNEAVVVAQQVERSFRYKASSRI